MSVSTSGAGSGGGKPDAKNGKGKGREHAALMCSSPPNDAYMVSSPGLDLADADDGFGNLFTVSMTVFQVDEVP